MIQNPNVSGNFGSWFLVGSFGSFGSSVTYRVLGDDEGFLM
jgi:hypothetical protein